MQRFFVSLLSLLLLLASTNLLWAQPENEPKVGLVLSGGGAKGIAQVGVLSVLESEGIRPDYITGTSIGSILGGLYAIGYSVEDLENLAMEVDWAYYFDDELERTYFPVEERDVAEKYQIRFTFDNGKIAFPTGVVRGKKIALLLSRLTIPAHGINNFDDFDIPFRGIATDFETGEAVVYGSGDLADVMRASMSIPSVFVPFRIDDKVLIDGGVVRNFPVEDVRKMGAKKVIGVDIGASLYKSESLSSILDVLDQTSSYRIVESNNAQAKLADVLIRPAIQDISALSFDQNDTLMYRGRLATFHKIPAVKSIVTKGKELRPRGVNIPTEVNVVELEITGCDEKQLKTIRNLLQIKTPRIYKLDDIENRIKKLYGSELVALGSYRLLPVTDGYLLKIKIEPQKGEFVRVSVNYDSRLKAGLLLNLTMRNRIFSGSKFNVDFKISENPAIDVDYFVYTSGRPNIGWHIGSRIHTYPGLTYDQGRKDDLFDLRHMNTEANIFSTFNNRVLMSLGGGIERYVRSDEFFDSSSGNLRQDQGFGQFRILRDSYNKEHFPTSGSYFELNAKHAFVRKNRHLQSDTSTYIAPDNTMVRAQASKAIPLGKKVSSILRVDGGFIDRAENNYLQRFYLGRSLPNELSHVDLFGLRYMEKQVSSYLAGQVKIQVEPVPNIFTNLVFNYAYLILENREIQDGLPTNKVTRSKDPFYGGGIELGWMTRIGPAIFTAEYNILEEQMNYSLHLGHEF